MRDEGMSQERLGQILYSRGISGLIIASHGREMGDALQFDWADGHNDGIYSFESLRRLGAETAAGTP